MSNIALRRLLGGRPSGFGFPARRSFTTTHFRPDSPKPAIYVSDSTNPWFNLAFEDWIFRKTDPEQVVLYMYRNTPSVIIGRNQNPWKEINLHKLGQIGIPFVRRMSGGGTVYHDLGNTNYCVFVPRNSFERRTNAELVARALAAADIPAFVNDRNDICVESFKMSRNSLCHGDYQNDEGADMSSSCCCSLAHVSGSAFKLVNKRAYHHGTMLIDAKLADLRGVLGTNKETMITKGVASVPSPVRNLVEWSPRFDHAAFVGRVAEEFARVYGGSAEPIRVDESELDSNKHAKDLSETMQTWDWMYGQTPEFTHAISANPPACGPITITINSKHGVITSAELTDLPQDAEWAERARELVASLEGDRYGSLEGAQGKVGEASGQGVTKRQALIDWLRREM